MNKKIKKSDKLVSGKDYSAEELVKNGCIEKINQYGHKIYIAKERVQYSSCGAHSF